MTVNQRQEVRDAAKYSVKHSLDSSNELSNPECQQCQCGESARTRHLFSAPKERQALGTEEQGDGEPVYSTSFCFSSQHLQMNIAMYKIIPT